MDDISSIPFYYLKKLKDGADADHRPPELLHHRRVQADVRQAEEHVDQGADGLAAPPAAVVGPERQRQQQLGPAAGAGPAADERLVAHHGHRVRHPRRGRQFRLQQRLRLQRNRVSLSIFSSLISN